MDSKEFNRIWSARLAALNENRERDLMIIAADLVALVKLRIQSSGRDYQEIPFSPYSPAYSRTRSKAGFQTQYVDFTRSGRLWASVRPFPLENTKATTTIFITASGEDNQNKLRGALARPRIRPRGNILIPSAKEIDWLIEANRKRIVNRLNLKT